MVQSKMPARHLKFISDAASQLLLSDEPLEVLGGVFESLSSHLGLEVYAYYPLDDENGILRLGSYRGISAGVAKSSKALKPSRSAIRLLETGRALERMTASTLRML